MSIIIHCYRLEGNLLLLHFACFTGGQHWPDAGRSLANTSSMPKHSSKAEPADINQLAKSTVEESTSNEQPEVPVDGTGRTDGKNPAAVALGRLGGKKGGRAGRRSSRRNGGPGLPRRPLTRAGARSPRATSPHRARALSGHPAHGRWGHPRRQSYVQVFLRRPTAASPNRRGNTLNPGAF